LILEKGSKRKGEEAEAKVHWLLVQRGFDCAWPVGDSATWDLIADWRGKVNRLQVKSRHKPDKRTTSSYYVRMGRGVSSSEAYSAKDFDFAIVVLPWACFIIPAKEVTGRKAATLVFFENGTHRYGRECEWEKYREAWHLLQ